MVTTSILHVIYDPELKVSEERGFSNQTLYLQRIKCIIFFAAHNAFVQCFNFKICSLACNIAEWET